MFLFVSVIILAVYFAYNCYIKLNYWKWKGVKYITPVPFFGNIKPLFFKQTSLTDFIISLYWQFPNERYYGIYQFDKPILLVKDLELIKKITITNFENFTEHQTYVTAKADPLWGSTLFSSQGKKRQEIRSYLTPLFTGSKLKTMFGLMNDCAKHYVDYFIGKNQQVLELEMKNIFERYTNDGLLTTAFGIQCDSLVDENNDFLTMGKDLTNFTGLKMAKIALYSNFSSLANLLGLKIISSKVGVFYQNLIDEIVLARKENNTFRPDLVNVLMGMKTGQVQNDEPNKKLQRNLLREPLTEHEMLSQAIVFFFGGFDTTSTLLAITAYELAKNPHVQDKLRCEFNKCQGQLTHEFLSEAKYADMVFLEVLRNWSQGIFGDRVCTKPFTIEPERPGEVRIDLKVGDIVWIPYAGIHKDPKYFPNPEKFDPERHSDENKHKIKSGTFNPFGLGPRGCIGSRFAFLQCKTVLYYVLTNFEIVPIQRTPKHLGVSTNSYTVLPDQDVWLGFKRLTV